MTQVDPQGPGDLQGGAPVDLERVRRVAGSVKDPEVRTSIAERFLLSVRHSMSRATPPGA